MRTARAPVVSFPACRNGRKFNEPFARRFVFIRSPKAQSNSSTHFRKKPLKVTCYGGVGEIGGNKILLEDRGTKVVLDFGRGFSDGSSYYDSRIEPRAVNGAGDLFEFGMLPEIPGLYSEKSLQNTSLKHTDPEVEAVVLSHFHSDHQGRISFVDEDVPVFCGEATALIHEASSETWSSPLDDHDIRRFRTGGKFKLGSMEFVPVHVDHSIPGAYGFIVHGSDGTVAYSGDFRFHGPAGSMTEDFLAAVRDSGADLLLTEGTRVGQKERGADKSESQVREEAEKLVGRSERLVFSSFRGNDIDRVNTFHLAAKASGRRLVVSMKIAAILDRLKGDRRILVPEVGKDVDVYVKRKKSGKLDDRDYFAWERKYLSSGVSAKEVRERQKDVFLHLESSSFPELIDIRPERGGTYIHSATEAFNEEGEQEEETVRNWIGHLGFSYHQLHASGHAPAGEVRRLVVGSRARRVVPIHTEHPDAFGPMVSERQKVEVPSKGVPISLA
jgi:ribonuclease J